jgi:hypothetical protein
MVATIWNPCGGGGGGTGTVTGSGTVTERFIATEAQTLITLTLFTYEVGEDDVQVYVNGALLTLTTDYVETSTSTITLSDALVAGDLITVVGIIGLATSTGSGTVKSVAVAAANGFNGTVATPTVAPVITLGTSISGVLVGVGGALTLAVSGTDVKTINGVSLLGAGDIVVGGGGGGGGGTGTVTSVSVAAANGFAGTVATPTTTPEITLGITTTGLLKGNGTAISKAVAGTDYQEPLVNQTNIKSINGVTLLGAGNITISGGAPDAWVVITANQTSVYGDCLQVNTTSGVLTITLPATPTPGQASIKVQDYLGTFSSNKLTLARNGSNIMGLAEDLDITTNWVALTLTFIDTTIGWRIS